MRDAFIIPLTVFDAMVAYHGVSPLYDYMVSCIHLFIC
jgi:hypothetical protein